MYPTILGFIDSYTLMLVLGVVACVVFLEIYNHHTSVPKILTSAYEINGLVAILIGLVFACLFQNLYDFIENPTNYKWTWAITFYGGLIGGVASFLLGYFLIIRKKFGPHMKELLVIAPACITVAHGFGRIGCFLEGCCYGQQTDAWYGVLFPGMEHKVIPTNLFEAIFLLLLAVGLFLLAYYKQFKYTFPVYMCSYGIWRFVIEYFRGDHRGAFIGNLSPSQFWSILLFVGGVVYFLVYFFGIERKKKPQNEASNSDSGK
jgi:phosphatidylglycerol:prolipoprotein diacylglycerol transferase